MPNKGRQEEDEQNLFAQITEDIDPALKVAKQNQFDGLADDINRIFQGDIRNFYTDDFPQAGFNED